MSEKKEALLKRVAKKAAVSYGYARLVSCGREKNVRVMKIITNLKQQELNELIESTMNEATTDFKKTA